MIPIGAKDCAREGPESRRLKNQRREVRRILAEQSPRLLEGYRAGDSVDPQKCRSQQAIEISIGYTGDKVKMNFNDTVVRPACARIKHESGFQEKAEPLVPMKQILADSSLPRTKEY
jgi:hypothetical protein